MMDPASTGHSVKIASEPLDLIHQSMGPPVHSEGFHGTMDLSMSDRGSSPLAKQNPFAP